MMQPHILYVSMVHAKLNKAKCPTTGGTIVESIETPYNRASSPQNTCLCYVITDWSGRGCNISGLCLKRSSIFRKEFLDSVANGIILHGGSSRVV
ncbi:hypothetical protein AYI70_g10926 [Smittium culicis]|uniref:Uncharacterized protein n=1 Tax=Smittium culicis TaxID=133412 RepID=A0A1R1X471_9FUNG|nr:hypothetical protein AYI70_g10926 [Smittium culicis]